MRMKDAEWDAVLDTNLKSVFRMSKLVMRGMMKAYGPHHQHHFGGGQPGNPGRPTTQRPRPAWQA